jgi:hypothetical protein
LISTPILAAKALALWARLLCPLAALSGLEADDYVVTPAALPALKSRFVNNPRWSALENAPFRALNDFSDPF